jgi:CRP/FNR family cyclic AMP-dependent transcriptional regulator
MQRILFILAELNDDDVAFLVEAGQRRFLARGATLVARDQPVDAIHIVLDGSFSVQVDGKLLNQLYRGEVVGELTFLDRRPPSASVIATEDARVLSVPHAALHRRLENPAFAGRFYKSLALFLVHRLRLATSTLAYGPPQLRQDGDELDMTELDQVDVAARRFDWMLGRLVGKS